jgi:hypothetical protein
MADLIQRYLPIIQRGWQLVEDFGVSRYSVTVRRYTWSGGEVGLGQRVPSDLRIVPNPPVVERESGRKLRVGPIMPKHAEGGYTIDQLLPADSAAGEYVYVVSGPNNTFDYAFGSIDTSDPVGWMLDLVMLELREPT